MHGLVGRHAERGRLEDALERARLGTGSIVLVSGEAGVGKTRLAAELAAGSDALLLRGAPSHGGAAPFGPVVPALRGQMRSNPAGLTDCGPLCGQLALLMPELGDPAPAPDRPALFEAMRCAFAHLAADRHVLLVLDDLQWSDEATLELLAALGELPVLVIGTYRSDGLPRDHGVRRLRNDLRRKGDLDEPGGRAPARRRPHQPGDRPGPFPQPAHGRHARAQHPAQARLPLTRRGRRACA